MWINIDPHQNLILRKERKLHNGRTNAIAFI